jgi:hypothetical protein
MIEMNKHTLAPRRIFIISILLVSVTLLISNSLINTNVYAKLICDDPIDGTNDCNSSIPRKTPEEDIRSDVKANDEPFSNVFTFVVIGAISSAVAVAIILFILRATSRKKSSRKK